MLFIGGLLMALAIEYWGLHKRIALRILMLVGSEPMWLMLGLMGATWFLSMWISNTATTSMMVPITEAILQQLQETLELNVLSPPGKNDSKVNGDVDQSTLENNGGTSVPDTEAPTKAENSEQQNGDRSSKGSDPEFDRLCTGMSLCICYSASCGGIGSLTGTNPNLILKENSDLFGEGMVMALFALLVIMWVTRDMGGQVGWGQLFHTAVKDSVPAVLVGILLFVLPSTCPWVKSYSTYAHPEKRNLAGPEREICIRPLLNWQIVHDKFPWQLLFLLGGGFALSGGFDKSGLSDWIGEQFVFFRDWNEWPVLIIICYIAAACTEVTSNTAMSSVLLPIMERLAANIGSHPLIYMFPVCLSTSFAFMLPVATPPNAIVFTYGRVNIADMMKAGAVMNLLAVPCVVLMTKTLGVAVFGFTDIPADFPLNATQLDVISM
ncbi:hypothetical protein EGW08_023554 [Elysia chlorotica]|uniref:Citrate transporter-like domain-containing protein n=1 Tax=Elysia chlorotica TaxID=188477 RepID=A0A3S1BJH0_ELYCH|nr:hypothetical protein EGW08_023554 [Elysia chlorotica]